MTKSYTRDGLNGTQLKIIALILMVFDHVYEFFEFTGLVPIWFKWLGRVVAPIFMFLIVVGYTHTRDKFKYMLRLYIGSVVMGVGNAVANTFFLRQDGFTIENNIFSTFLMIVVYMAIVDFLIKAFAKNNSRDKLLGLVFLFIPILLGIGVTALIEKTGFTLIGDIIPNIVTVEGGPVFVVLGVVFYLTRDNLTKLVQAYSIFCISILIGSLIESRSIYDLFMRDYQWMMIFSIYFFYRYNGEKGRGYKYLFYVFYPLHIYVLFLLSYLLIGR